MARVGQLTICLGAIADNWQNVRAQLAAHVTCGAVVKADAYGLGVGPVASKLYKAGCRDFFVANCQEAEALDSFLLGVESKSLPERFAAVSEKARHVRRQRNIYILSGVDVDDFALCAEKYFTPVLISLPMVKAWVAKAKGMLPAIIKVNTGMNRLGVEAEELYTLVANAPQNFSAVRYLMSHFACADEAASLNEEQLSRFNTLLTRLRVYLPQLKATLANSGAIFRLPHSHFDLVRPGVSLYGGSPDGKIKMKTVVTLRLPIIQTQHVQAGDAVGYGATKVFHKDAVLAVCAGGYADGILRSLSGCGEGFWGGYSVPIVGRISMDSTVFDITEIYELMKASGQSDDCHSIELMGHEGNLDRLATMAGTISYELLTSLGARYDRHYR